MNSTGQKRLAFYARVSSKEQAKNLTIQSQVAELHEVIASAEGILLPEDCYIDEHYSGETLLRPDLDRLRDSIAWGHIDCLYVYDIDRLARGFTAQVFVLDEIRTKGVEVIFLHGPTGECRTPEELFRERMLGAFAEYERLKIRERTRRGKLFRARNGQVNVLSNAPYGYRYIDKLIGGGQASYQIVEEHAKVVRQVFDWVSQERVSLRQVCQRLKNQQIPSPKGGANWPANTVLGMLRNPAYKGEAGYGKTEMGAARPRTRPAKGRPKYPHRVGSIYQTPEKAITIKVPALVSEETFAAVAEQLEENKKRHRAYAKKGELRYLLSGLVVCKQCGYGMYGKPAGKNKGEANKSYAFYRCRGSDANRFGGQRICNNKAIRSDLLDEQVWEDICELLSDPGMIEREQKRREASTDKQERGRAKEESKAQLKAIQQGMDRLLDAYTEGHCSKEQFTARMTTLENRKAALQAEEKKLLDMQQQKEALRSLVTSLEEFTKGIALKLQTAEPALKKELFRKLISHVEVDDSEINVVYRIALPPFDRGPAQPFLPHCNRHQPAERIVEKLPGSRW